MLVPSIKTEITETEVGFNGVSTLENRNNRKHREVDESQK